jgi:serpin B
MEGVQLELTGPTINCLDQLTSNKMIVTILSRWVFLMFFMTTLNVHPSDTLGPKDTNGLAGGNTAFALNLYAQLRTTDENLFFSPYSISTCLAMTYAGARGNTDAQMAQTLHFGTNQNQLAASFCELQGQLNNDQPKQANELNIANGMWAQNDQPLLPAYLKVAREKYGANLKQSDFRNGSEAARLEINNWVSDQTKGKICNLIQAGLLGPSTRLVLVNAIYFKGRWASEFDQHNTIESTFSIAPTQKLQVPLMSLTANFKYAEVEGLQVLELPYAGNDLAMVILLPDETDGLKTLEKQLNEASLYRWLAPAREQKVAVFLPKFKLSAQFSLAKDLAAMGMTDAFSPRADFSGMDGQRDLFISAVVHKAFVDVNEEGTEAAAATGVVMRSMAVMRPRPTPVFRADHPFIFLIRDTRSGGILFLGRMVDPSRS